MARLSVKAAEYSYTLSRPAVSAGEVIVELNNQGEDPHNLNLQREGSEDPPLAGSPGGVAGTHNCALHPARRHLPALVQPPHP